MSLREKLVRFGAHNALSGVLTLPNAKDAAAPGLLLFNAGIVHRIGPHRLNVKIARTLAQQGVASLRFDLCGLGDSAPVPAGGGAMGGGASQRTADIKAALAELGAASGAARFALAGLCSGADDGYRAALGEPRIVGLALLDPYAYENCGAKIERAAAKALDPERWKSALARAVRPKKGAAVQAASGSVDDSSRPHPPAVEFGAELNNLTDRGVKILILYTKFVEEQLTRPAHFFDTFSAFDFGGRLAVEISGGVDHTYTELAAQRALIARIGAFVMDLRAP